MEVENSITLTVYSSVNIFIALHGAQKMIMGFHEYTYQDCEYIIRTSGAGNARIRLRAHQATRIRLRASGNHVFVKRCKLCSQLAISLLKIIHVATTVTWTDTRTEAQSTSDPSEPFKSTDESHGDCDVALHRVSLAWTVRDNHLGL